MRVPGLVLRAWLAMICLAGALCPMPAAAHEVRPLIAEAVLEPDGQVALVLRLNAEALTAGVGAEHADTADSPAAARYDALRAMAPAALEAELATVLPNLVGGIRLGTDVGPVSLVPDGIAIPKVGDVAVARLSEVRLRGRLPGGATALTWALEPGLGDSVIRVRRAGEPEPFAATYVAAGDATPPLPIGAAVPARPVWAVAADYVAVGFEHIVPKGLDHILFVAGLFLLSARARPLLWQVTMFTLAHTVTLALGLLGIVRVAPEIVEPLIAASIVYVAVDNIRGDRLGRWRPAVVFGFGLLHGLGFAGVLAEYGLPSGHFVPALVGFNVGVELGQLAVLACCFLAVGFWFGGRAWYREIVVIPGSAAIAAVALFWVAERTGLVV